MSPHDGQQDDRDATNYAALPATDTDHTRYSDAPADPHATAYTPTSGATDTAAAGRLPRRFGGYELLSELGHGGMGVVYKAKQLAPERMVALKLIRSGELADAEDVRRFRQEADEAARLDHPHIVPVYEVGEQGGLHFFTMKLVEGGSLSQHLERYQNDPKSAAKLTATAARAVHYAHQRQLLHRDLKPGNILLDAAGKPHVADFGLAKRMGGAGEASQSHGVGTPEYMAPEQARGDARLTTAADVYALGGVLYALLTGRPPFRGDSSWATIEKVLTEEPTPPSKLRPGAPRDLETICLKCLQKEPAKRYGSAEALAEDLERWLRGEPIKGRPVGKMERAWLWCRRNPATAGLSTAFAIALLLGAGVSTYFGLDAREQAKQTGIALGKVNERDKQVGEANTQLNETNKQMEATLARSMLRPIGHDGTKVHDTEIEALWELAGSNERIRLLFIDQALQGPMTTRQLQTRANLAVHAMAGLDPTRRQEVEKLLLARLRDKESDFNIRTDCVLIGQSLGEWSPEYAEAATRQAADAIGKTESFDAVRSLAEVLTTLTPRLGPGAAARLTAATALRAVRALVQTTDLETRRLLTEALIALAPGLTPEAAEAAAQPAVEAMAASTDAETLHSLAEVVTALAPRLGPAAAAEATRQMIEAMGKTADPKALAKGVAVLAPRLAPEAAGEAARQTVQAMGKMTDTQAIYSLSDMVTALAPRLEPAEGARLTAVSARLAVEAMDKATSPYALTPLANTIAALTPRLEPTEAARLASAAIKRAVQVMGASKVGDDVLLLKNAAAALAPLLGPEEAATAAGQIVETIGRTDNPNALHALTDTLAALGPSLGSANGAAAARQAVEAMAKTTNPYFLESLATGVAALAPHLERNEAAQWTAAAARRIAEEIGMTNTPDAFYRLTTATTALAPRLKPEDAAAAARQVVETMSKTTNPEALRPLAAAIAPLVRRVKSAEAARLATTAARQAIEAMGKTDDYYAVQSLADAVKALASLTEGEEAAQLTAAAARQAVEAMDKLTDPLGQGPLAAAVTSLAPQLERDEATTAARLVVDLMGKKFALYDLSSQTQALTALAPRLNHGEARRLTATAAGYVGKAMTKTADPYALSSLSAAAAALAPWLERDGATTAARQVVEAIGKTTDSNALSLLAGAVEALTPRLEPDEATRLAAVAARQTVETMGKAIEAPIQPDMNSGMGLGGGTDPTADGTALRSLVETMEGLIVQAAPEDVSRRSRLLALAVGSSAAPQVCLFGLAPLSATCPQFPGRFTNQQLVDLMKMPTCREPARQVIVRQLGWQCGRPFANQWEFVEWWREHLPDLDLTSSPIRPTPP